MAVDISGWSDARVMQLPDHVFGERKVTGCWIATAGSSVYWDISAVSLPAKIVMWQLHIWTSRQEYLQNRLRLAFGATVPTSEAEMDALTPVLEDYGDTDYTPPRIEINIEEIPVDLRLRQLADTDGKKLVMEVANPNDSYIGVRVGLVYSAVPSEIPAWPF